jgi:DNA-binding CsgD family transcriptional regulator
MTAAAASGPNASSRLRIAITSPDILARVRQVFASKNLEVEIVRMPYIEVAVRPAASTAGADGSAVGSALHRLAGPAAPEGSAAAAHRLRAEYRLGVVGVGDGLRAERPEQAGRRRAEPERLPDPGAGAGADDPAVGLSQRQREVMALVSRGVRNTEIAARLEVSEKTVKNHVNRIFRLLGARNRVEAVLIWQRHERDAAARRGSADAASASAPAREPDPELEWVTEY